jgi:hypothetical protein
MSLVSIVQRRCAKLSSPKRLDSHARGAGFAAANGNNLAPQINGALSGGFAGLIRRADQVQERSRDVYGSDEEHSSAD